MKASPKATPAFVNWTPAREKRPGPAVRAPRFVGEAAPGVFGVLGVWALGLGEKGVCWVALFCGVVDISVRYYVRDGWLFGIEFKVVERRRVDCRKLSKPLLICVEELRTLPALHYWW